MHVDERFIKMAQMPPSANISTLILECLGGHCDAPRGAALPAAIASAFVNPVNAGATSASNSVLTKMKYLLETRVSRRENASSSKWINWPIAATLRLFPKMIKGWVFSLIKSSKQSHVSSWLLSPTWVQTWPEFWETIVIKKRWQEYFTCNDILEYLQRGEIREDPYSLKLTFENYIPADTFL